MRRAHVIDADVDEERSGTNLTGVTDGLCLSTFGCCPSGPAAAPDEDAAVAAEWLEEVEMTFVRLALFPEATREQYDRLARAMSHAPVPAERLLFAAGPVQGGWQVVQVWTSKTSFDDCNRAHFFPASAALGGSVFPTPQVVTDFEPVDVHLA